MYYRHKERQKSPYKYSGSYRKHYRGAEERDMAGANIHQANFHSGQLVLNPVEKYLNYLTPRTEELAY